MRSAVVRHWLTMVTVALLTVALLTVALPYSLLQVPNFPGTGTERGVEGRHANVINAPLPYRASSGAFRRAWRDQLLPAVRNITG